MKFWKYQGAGNDFVMVDQRIEKHLSRADEKRIQKLCDRRFGIGADGLILLQKLDGYDFEMVYFNADGRESTMCGNGGRCIAAFAKKLGLIDHYCRFWAIDGEHEAQVTGNESNAWVELKMGNVKYVAREGNTFILNTGSPHYVRFEQEIADKNLVLEGRAVRYSEPFEKEGINVNLVCASPNGQGLQIRTYERGVEDETYACGTGVTAAAIASFFVNGGQPGRHEVAVEAMGGKLSVRFEASKEGTFDDIWLCGPAAFVFEGVVE
jgi:diaminopimelate epimerase